MGLDTNTLISNCLRLMVRPVALFCVRRGIKFRQFVEISKTVFVNAAEDELSRQGVQSSTSKISIMTGLQRFEVKRLAEEEGGNESERSLVVRVVGLWSGSSRFQDARGRSRKLTYRGARSEFAKLVRAVSKDLNPHTVLFELERLGILEKTEEFVTLKQHAFVPKGDPETGMRMVANDAADLISAGSENAFSEHIVPNLHARTEYDNVSDEAISQIKLWLLELGSRIHAECRAFLSRFDRDISGETGGTGRNRIIVGTFGYVQPNSEPEPEGKKGRGR